jgi:serine/threonine protein kinase
MPHGPRNQSGIAARTPFGLWSDVTKTIHDVGVASVAGGGETEFIVMELLEGETLQHRLTRGPLEVSEVVEIGVALTDALAAAHGQGIIHRDIKPANVLLTKHVAWSCEPSRPENTAGVRQWT